MFSLVFWKIQKSSSVILSSDIKRDKALSDWVSARWGNKRFHAKVIATSDNEEELTALNVSKNGELLQNDSEEKSMQKKAVKRKTDDATKAVNQKIKKNEKQMEKILIEQSSIFEEEEFLSAEPPDSPLSLHVISPPLPKIRNEAKAEASREKCIACEDFVVDADSITVLENVLNWMKSKYFQQDNKSRNELGANNTFTYQSGSKVGNYVELVEGSGVRIKHIELEIILQKCKGDPNEMIRQLLKKIIGEDKLLNMTPCGRNRDRIPANVLEAVYQYITIVRKMKISHKDYIRILTQMCCAIRKSNEERELIVGKTEKKYKPKDDECVKESGNVTYTETESQEKEQKDEDEEEQYVHMEMKQTEMQKKDKYKEAAKGKDKEEEFVDKSDLKKKERQKDEEENERNERVEEMNEMKQTKKEKKDRNEKEITTDAEMGKDKKEKTMDKSNSVDKKGQNDENEKDRIAPSKEINKTSSDMKQIEAEKEVRCRKEISKDAGKEKDDEKKSVDSENEKDLNSEGKAVETERHKHKKRHKHNKEKKLLKKLTKKLLKMKK